MESQTKAILDHLQGGHAITALDALYMFGCLRLAARIYDIRGMGYDVEKEMVEMDDARVAKYWIPR